MPFTQKKYHLKAITRTNARIEIVEQFLAENFGYGTGKLASKYEYVVEECGEYKIILRRPAFLNKGFDFTVHIVGTNFSFKPNKRKLTNPSHADIIGVFHSLQNTVDKEKYNEIKSLIVNIYDFKQYELNSLGNVCFKDWQGIDRPVQIILLAIKWLFIEQDITYWNFSGRNMLMNRLKTEKLV